MCLSLEIHRMRKKNARDDIKTSLRNVPGHLSRGARLSCRMTDSFVSMCSKEIRVLLF